MVEFSTCDLCADDLSLCPTVMLPGPVDNCISFFCIERDFYPCQTYILVVPFLGASSTLFLSLFLVLCWRRRHHHLEAVLPTNNLGNAVVNAEAGQIQAERLAIASDDSEGLEPNQDGFQEQELNSVHDQ